MGVGGLQVQTMGNETLEKPERLAPIHPGEILEVEFLRPMNVGRYRLAKSIGVNARRVHAIIKGERSVSADTALLFSRFFGNSARFWMGPQSQYDLEAAGRVDRGAEQGRRLFEGETRDSFSHMG